MAELIGMAGLILLLIGWIPETISNYRKKGKGIDFKFATLYFFGSVLLAWHALNLNDLVFLALNTAAAAMAAINVWIILKNKERRYV